MAHLICTHCGTADRTALPGSGGIEVVLWLAAIVPGAVYSIWRRGGAPACAKCGHRALVATDTPAGQRLAVANYAGGLPAAAPPAPPPKAATVWQGLALVLIAFALLVLYARATGA